MPNFDIYQSPYSWRYGSAEMRALWSETNRRRLWRYIWVQLAQAQAEFGLVRQDQVEDLRLHRDQIDIPRSLEIEAEIHHDLMAEIKTFAEQAPLGGGILHLGATSMDIEDNADALRLRQATQLLLTRLKMLLLAFADQIERYAAMPIIAFTHIQPAEPSTLGYRLSTYAQDFLLDWSALSSLAEQIKGKGFKSAVGTAASYVQLLGADRFTGFEQRMSQLLELPFYPLTTQTYPRKQDYTLLSALAGLGITLSRFAFDLRLLQSPVIGELSEPFGKKQVGSSAMPFKRNPINAEKINSLARMLANLPLTAWHNAAHSLLERTLDDSANRRTLLPESFLICDELLTTTVKIVRGLVVNESAVKHNLAAYAPFAATERLLMALVQAGADRQLMHEQLREHALTAWQYVQKGQPNPLAENLTADANFNTYLTPDQISQLMQVEDYLGIAPQRAMSLAAEIRARVG